MEVQLIFPENMNFVFQLSTRDCYRRLTGQCSLDEDTNENVEQEKNQVYCGKWHYCKDMHLAILDKKLDGKTEGETIRIAKYSCGHYAVSGGQHRLCIAKRKKLPIFAELSEEMTWECPVCKKKNESNYFLY